GKVLVVGGVNGGAYSTALLYDPSAGTWATTGSMSSGRYDHSATLLPSGKVLVAGGNIGPLSTAWLYDPATASWTAAGSMSSARATHTATLLPNGMVLVAGNSSGSTAELVYYSEYQPDPAWVPVIQTVPQVFDRGMSVTATGLRFQGVSE